MREIPFTIIQFPLYEYLKSVRAKQQGLPEVAPIEGAICGSFAGGVAAALTTPLDVIKTRLMLHKTSIGVTTLVRNIIAEDGYKAFWKGIGPRTMWISAGGAIFLGVYELVKKNTLQLLEGNGSAKLESQTQSRKKKIEEEKTSLPRTRFTIHHLLLGFSRFDNPIAGNMKRSPLPSIFVYILMKLLFISHLCSVAYKVMR